MVSICTSCGGAFAAPLDLCHACAITLRTTTARARGARPLLPGKAVACPLLVVPDVMALERLLRTQQHGDDMLARALRAKLGTARIAPPDAVLAEVATLGSRVVFAIDDGRPEARVLVLPHEHSPAGWTLPVTTPHGLALLGHAAGAAVTVAREGGRAETLRLLAVSARPETGSASAEVPRRRENGRGRSGSVPPLRHYGSLA